jgi:hypothetical protein
MKSSQYTCPVTLIYYEGLSCCPENTEAVKNRDEGINIVVELILVYDTVAVKFLLNWNSGIGTTKKFVKNDLPD